MTYTESGLEFDFDDTWEVKKYDEHPFYRKMSGYGLKAVDFIGIWKQDVLVLMEVKNFKVRFDALKELPIQSVLQNPDQFAIDMIKKVEDSLKAIDAIHTYYQRKWWFRLLNPFINWFTHDWFDWPFWTRVHNLIDSEREIWIVLWLESEFTRDQLKLGLKYKMGKGLDEFTDRIFISHRENHPFGKHLHVNYE